MWHSEAYGAGAGAAKRKKRLADKILPQKVRDLVPESQAYMDLLAFERKLDATIMRKRLDIQEALKRPMKQKRKLRIFISNTFYPGMTYLFKESIKNIPTEVFTYYTMPFVRSGRQRRALMGATGRGTPFGRH